MSSRPKKTPKNQKHINILSKSPDPGDRWDMQAKRDTNLTNSEKCTILIRRKCMHLNAANYILNSHGWENINLALFTSYLCDLDVTSNGSPHCCHHPFPHLQNCHATSQCFLSICDYEERQWRPKALRASLCSSFCVATTLPSSVCAKDPDFVRACKYVGGCFLFPITYCSQNIKSIF